MKKYNYKIIEQGVGEPDEQFLTRLNELAGNGYRFILETTMDSSGRGRDLLEKCWEE